MEQSDRNFFLENAIKNSKPKLLNLADFTFEEILGTGNEIFVKIGSFARVKLGQEKNSKNYYAIKIMKKEELIKLGQVEHILNEMKIMNYLKHPFVV
jgi:serine/threonine protein kinase